MDDVVVPERRKSIRNIPIPERRGATRLAVDGMKKSAPPRASLEAELPPEPPMPPRHIRPSSGSSGRRRLYMGLAGALVLLFVIFSLFNGATLAYVPRTAPLSFSGETFSAYKSAGQGLLYSVVKLSGDKGVAVAATGETDVSRKASGTIVVYNDTAEVQPLVATTRFESADGKVYRIDKAITVPKKSATAPGSVEAVVYADQPGASYNIAPTDFTLPGLKGTPKYTTVYARSKTAMANGFIGKEKSVSSADLTQAKLKLQSELSEELVTKTQAEVPGDFILFPALTSVAFEDLPQTAASGSQVTVNIRGTLYGVMFKKADLALALSLGKAARAASDPVEIADYDALKISFASTTSTDVLNASKVDFKVAGNTLLVWRTDEVSLKSDLAGRKKSELAQILKNYPTVSSATAAIRPFWKASFPEDATKIILKKANQ